MQRARGIEPPRPPDPQPDRNTADGQQRQDRSPNDNSCTHFLEHACPPGASHSQRIKREANTWYEKHQKRQKETITEQEHDQRIAEGLTNRAANPRIPTRVISDILKRRR